MKKYISLILILFLNILSFSIFAQNDLGVKDINKEIMDVDPFGIGLTIIGMGVVFGGLIAIYIMLFYLSKVILYQGKQNLARQQNKEIKKQNSANNQDEGESMSGEVNAAIALAIYLNKEESHDMIDAVLTIKNVAKTYSPWSSKIYNMRQVPNK